MNFQYPFFAASGIATILAIVAIFRGELSISRWAFIGGMLILALENGLSGMGSRALSLPEFIDWQSWRLIVSGFIPAPWLAFSLTYARGNAREFLRPWLLGITFSVVFPVVLVFAFRGSLIEPSLRENGNTVFRIGLAGIALNIFVLASCILVLMHLERTFRASVGTMRWRIKFMLLGGALLFLVRLYTTSQALLFRALDLPQQIFNAAAVIVGSLLILRALLRTRHFSLDVYPSRSVLQHSFTVILAGAYLLIVGIFAKLVTYLGGDSAFALKAFLALVSLVFLALLLQSDRLRLQLRRYVSRNFQRPLYDYRTAWMKFSEGTASRIEPTDLSRTIVRLVAEMFEVLSVSLWILDEKKNTLGLSASTSVSNGNSLVARDSAEHVPSILRFFKDKPHPLDLEEEKSDWAAWVRDLQPSEFAKGGHRLCVPMTARGELVGLLILGDRVSGQPFTLQDFDMLKCLGDHAAGTLMNSQFSNKLVQAKEIEAFQTMATFFVHDLKNAASTLHLMLQNLPIHFNDPEFREDALRGVAKSVGHINRLVSRLGQLRKELTISPVPLDLRQVFESSLHDFPTSATLKITTEFRDLPLVPIDRDQITKVFTNLVLNAHEAMHGAGQIKVETRREHAWAVVVVKDSGCGMTEDFLTNSLFRPFQTTKPNGLGIGMFQSKMIVEAHGGRLTAASVVGAGTTFQIFLPLEPS